MQKILEALWDAISNQITKHGTIIVPAPKTLILNKKTYPSLKLGHQLICRNYYTLLHPSSKRSAPGYDGRFWPIASH